MPYIKSKEDRAVINDILYKYMDTLCKKGSLNYFLCKMFTMMDLNYDTARKFIGEIECAKIEIYRRFIAPYEDRAKKNNGDII